MEWRCTQKSKIHLSGGKLLFLDGRVFQYTFDCVRGDGRHTTVTIEAGPNDDDARKLAELECEAREP